METTSTPKNFFLQMGIIVALYASTVSFITFLFDLIDRVFPADSVGYYYDPYSGTMRFAISTLIVMFPLFIFLSRLYRKSVLHDVALKDSKLRKWLLYFTLFLAGLTIAIDLIMLINKFLQGSDITTAFILKALAIFLVAALIFYFYLLDVQGKWEGKEGTTKTFAWVLSAVVLASIVGGIIYIGSPAKQRMLTRDMQRVNDLQTIQWQIVNYYQSKGVLPDKLDDLRDSISGFSIPLDPSPAYYCVPSHADCPSPIQYSYSTKLGLSFELCDSFETASTLNTGLVPAKAMYPSDYGMPADNWVHTSGRVCFDRTIDPDRYPITPKTRV